jgi:hypothetical protein
VTVLEAVAEVGFGPGKYILQLFMNYDCQNLHPTNATFEFEKLKCIVGHVKFS